MTEFERAAIEQAAAELAPHIVETPLLTAVDRYASETPAATALQLKCEFLQRSGSFKFRGAMLHLLRMPEAARAAGIVAVSAGNHAAACALAARAADVSATVVMIANANRRRRALCRAYGANVVVAGSIHDAFATCERLVRDEGRYLVHPFDAELTVLGSATLGREIALAAPDAEAVIVPTGGGGLLAGVSVAVSQWLPSAQVFGVEPEGADSMSRSLAAGAPVELDRVDTVADSLGAPGARDYSFGLCQRYAAGVVRVGDAAIRAGMRRLFDDYGLALEPAPAAALAALDGPLRERLAGRRVVALLCGSNIDWATYRSLLDTPGEAGNDP